MGLVPLCIHRGAAVAIAKLLQRLVTLPRASGVVAVFT